MTPILIKTKNTILLENQIDIFKYREYRYCKFKLIFRTLSQFKLRLRPSLIMDSHDNALSRAYYGNGNGTKYRIEKFIECQYLNIFYEKRYL